MTMNTSRRAVLKGAAAMGAALIVGFDAKGALAATDAAGEAMAPNPFVRIAADGTVTAIVKHFEMGQGASTGLTTLIAEELDAEWDAVKVEFAPADGERYGNLAFGGMQGTGGSTAIANSYMQYRKAAAAARAMLEQAAAKRWGVPIETVTVYNGVVKAGADSAAFADLLADAAKEEPPAEPTLKPRRRWRYIGSESLPRKDSSAKTDGSAKFAMDATAEGMLVCVIARPPKFGGKVKSVKREGAFSVLGVASVRELPVGVAVYANNTWAAIKGREALEVEWDFSDAETRSSDQMMSDLRAMLDEPGVAANEGADFDAAAQTLEAAASRVEVEFTFPYLAHAPMEPLNCLIEPTEGGVKVTDGCQFPALTQPTVAALLGLAPNQVEINTVYAGGSFGRRATPTSDYHAEAAMAYAAIGAETPVKLVWTREDDLAGGYYRPLAAHRVSVGFGEDGAINAWEHRVAADSFSKGTAFEGMMIHGGVDHAMVEGVADTPYTLPGMAVGAQMTGSRIPTLWWRSVGHTHTAFVMESVMDMAAEQAGMDPVAFRRAHLEGAGDDQKRLRGVLDAAADAADWDAAPGEGKGRGVAMHKSFGSYVAMVADVSTDEDGYVSIDKVTCAVDCGVAVNPDVIRAQIEGGVGYGLGAIMRNEITLTDGEVDQANFPDYEPLRISDMPEVEVVIMHSDAAPSGIGEPGVPPIGPAVANAIYAATGTRVLDLPMTKAGVEFA